MHVVAGKVASTSVEHAVHCKDGCSALQERLQCTASEKGKTGTEIASPILDKRVLATVLARTCDLPCTYLQPSLHVLAGKILLEGYL